MPGWEVTSEPAWTEILPTLRGQAPTAAVQPLEEPRSLPLVVQIGLTELVLQPRFFRQRCNKKHHD